MVGTTGAIRPVRQTQRSPDGRFTGGNVVVVGVNHRLNAFGYLYLGNSVPEFALSGNVGQLDPARAAMGARQYARFGATDKVMLSSANRARCEEPR
jgi:carboxylesterase type B